MGKFDFEQKGNDTYLDFAANGSGVDKSGMTVDLLHSIHDPLQPENVDMVEIGPGGGAALEALTGAIESQLPTLIGRVGMDLIELDGIESESLSKVREKFSEIGESRLHKGDARELDKIIGENNADIVIACAVFHEVYSYGGGYEALQDAFVAASRTIRPGGHLVYRDIVAVPGQSLFERSKNMHSAESWVRFARMFLPYYLDNAQHPYEHEDNRVIFEQDSRIVHADAIEPTKPLVIDAPIGIFRELQRHYITFRDHVWRSHMLDIVPVLDGPLASNWIDADQGHKRIHFDTVDENQVLEYTNETDSDGHFVIDSDKFDAMTDTRLARFLEQAEDPQSESAQVLQKWLDREGSETYVYHTLNRLIGSVALDTFRGTDGDKILLPKVVNVSPRAYYTRYLTKRLDNPLTDGGQRVLFQALEPHSQPDLINEAMNRASEYCSEEVMSQIHGSLK